jgi:integrase
MRRSRKHLAFTRNRITRLCEECGWRFLREITSDGFNRWRAAQKSLGPKTCNEYSGHIAGFLTWLLKNGHLTRDPLQTVSKAETKGFERRVRRALSDSELSKLVQSPGGRGLIYSLAASTGLRRGEIKALHWADLHLDGVRPFIAVRAATTRNKKMVQRPLMPAVAAALRASRPRTGHRGQGVSSRRTQGQDTQAGPCPVQHPLPGRVWTAGGFPCPAPYVQHESSTRGRPATGHHGINAA